MVVLYNIDEYHYQTFNCGTDKYILEKFDNYSGDLPRLGIAGACSICA